MKIQKKAKGIGCEKQGRGQVEKKGHIEKYAPFYIEKKFFYLKLLLGLNQIAYLVY
jgi:hypothetical protein